MRRWIWSTCIPWCAPQLVPAGLIGRVSRFHSSQTISIDFLCRQSEQEAVEDRFCLASGLTDSITVSFR
jgi:hypothetical protein